MWIQTKHNYDRHVERMENWKDISEEENWAFKVGLVPLFFMSWEASMFNVMLEFFNTFIVATPLWAKCEDEIHTPKSGNLESSRTPATSELDSRGQNTSP
jgi:hypothetical protein